MTILFRTLKLSNSFPASGRKRKIFLLDARSVGRLAETKCSGIPAKPSRQPAALALTSDQVVARCRDPTYIHLRTAVHDFLLRRASMS